METRLGWEVGDGLGAPGGPCGSEGAWAWLKGGPTPGAACWRGLMGETARDQGKRWGRCPGREVWPSLPPLPCIITPGLTARAQPSLLVLGSLHCILGSHLSCAQVPRNLEIEGTGLMRTMHPSPGVTWGHTPHKAQAPRL